MKAAILVFPGSNCDRDLAVGFRQAGAEVEMVWHKNTELPEGTDIVGIPGGFSYGDYLRCGAIAAQSAIIPALKAHVEQGGYALGICNGFQVLTETGLLPGALIRNAGLRFICRTVGLSVRTTNTAFTQSYALGQDVQIPIAHADGQFVADEATLDLLAGDDRIAFSYRATPNGSARDIAGILSENRRVLGMMPHPERAVEPLHGSTDGAALFASLAETLTVAA